jgi:Transcriptional regulatory protein, C terminal
MNCPGQPLAATRGGSCPTCCCADQDPTTKGSTTAPSDAAAGSARFGVLGPLLVVDGAGAAWAVPAAKQRIVLATLLLATGRTVSAADLAEALWDVSPLPNAPAAMRTYVTRLRRAMGPASARIIGRPAGWADAAG